MSQFNLPGLRILFIIMRNFAHLLIFVPVLLVATTDPGDIVITVLSQRDGYSRAQAELLRENVINQANDLEKNPPLFLLTHERIGEKEIKGAWTIYPIIPILHSEYANAQWHLFCQENTVIKLERLMTVLSRFNSSMALWLGHALHDTESTIIHHFADPTTRFSYPNIASGFVISKTLIETLKHRLNSGEPSENDFTIDAPYELSNFVYNNGKGPRLTQVPEFCVVSSEECATYPKKSPPCGNPVPIEGIFFAIKTYNENHSKRIPILIKTWLRYTFHYALFSNEKDEQLRNIIVVPHTDRGHCGKTYGLLQHAEKIMKKKKIVWLVVTDDDTILSVSRLSHLLSCYNPKKPVAIGERYGFSASEETGYEYLTGGAGLAISAPMISKILASATCKCPMLTTPDDMFLFGICLARLGLSPTHSPLFHQARPQDYAGAYLASQEPVSFHKFWMIHPIQVYQDWFDDEDSTLSFPQHRTEL